MARYRARRKARAQAEREHLEALEDAAAALGEKLPAGQRYRLVIFAVAGRGVP